MSVCSTMAIARTAFALAIARSALAHDGKAETVALKFAALAWAERAAYVAETMVPDNS